MVTTYFQMLIVGILAFALGYLTKNTMVDIIEVTDEGKKREFRTKWLTAKTREERIAIVNKLPFRQEMSRKYPEFSKVIIDYAEHLNSYLEDLHEAIAGKQLYFPNVTTKETEDFEVITPKRIG